LMDQAANSGAILFPPVPAFYTHPQKVDDIVDNIVGRVLRRMGIENNLYTQWQGITGQVIAEGSQQAQSTAAASSALPIEELWSLPVITLATSDSAGFPHAADVYFAADDEKTLFFFSSADSQHARNFVNNPQAAATIHPLVDNWQEIRGLQLRGEVQAVEPGEEWEKAWGHYLVKFPFAGDLKEIITQNTLYAFRPQWIRLIDNRRGFGFKEEWTLNK
jgi:uncharacterized protein